MSAPVNDEEFPWYLKTVMFLALLVVLFVIVIDVLKFASVL